MLTYVMLAGELEPKSRAGFGRSNISNPTTLTRSLLYLVSGNREVPTRTALRPVLELQQL